MTLQEAVDRIEAEGFAAIIEPAGSNYEAFVRGGSYEDPNAGFAHAFVIIQEDDKWICRFHSAGDELCESFDEAVDFAIARLWRKRKPE